MERRSLPAELLVDVEIGAGLVDRFLHPPVKPGPIAKGVGHDGKQPGLRVGAGLEAMSVAVGSHVSLLDQVLGILRLARQAQRATVEGVEMLFKPEVAIDGTHFASILFPVWRLAARARRRLPTRSGRRLPTGSAAAAAGAATASAKALLRSWRGAASG